MEGTAFEEDVGVAQRQRGGGAQDDNRGGVHGWAGIITGLTMI